MLAPDSVQNIRAVLDADNHALPVWAIRALRLLLDEREHLIAGLIGETATEEMAKVRRRLSAARMLLEGWRDALDQRDLNPSNVEFERGYTRAVRDCLHDLRAVLTQDFSGPLG